MFSLIICGLMLLISFFLAAGAEDGTKNYFYICMNVWFAAILIIASQI